MGPANSIDRTEEQAFELLHSHDLQIAVAHRLDHSKRRSDRRPHRRCGVRHGRRRHELTRALQLAQRARLGINGLALVRRKQTFERQSSQFGCIGAGRHRTPRRRRKFCRRGLAGSPTVEPSAATGEELAAAAAAAAAALASATRRSRAATTRCRASPATFAASALMSSMRLRNPARLAAWKSIICCTPLHSAGWRDCAA